MKLSRKMPRADVPNAAMGDIAFNLLIFFVILAKANDDSNLQWTPADGSNLQTATAVASVVVDKKGRLYLNGSEVGQEQLKASLERTMANAETEQQRTVHLKVHNKTRRDKYEPIIGAISEAGGVMIHVLNEEN